MIFDAYTIALNLNDFVWGSSYFKWRDVLYCPKWDVCPAPSDEQIKNIVHSVGRLDIIRLTLNRDIIVINGIRPNKYNEFVGGAPESAHKTGRGLDFIVKGMSCDVVRAFLEPRLEELKIRMEKKAPGPDKIHIDTKEPGPSGRYFDP